MGMSLYCRVVLLGVILYFGIPTEGQQPEPGSVAIDIGGNQELTEGLVFIACFVALIIVLSVVLVFVLKLIEKKVRRNRKDDVALLSTKT